MTRKRPVCPALIVLVAAFGGYELTASFVAHAGDAYVQSDLVSPQVTGRIIMVHVADNQDVAEGRSAAPSLR